MRQDHWYFFGSTGWKDEDWAWSPVYDQMGKCGKPLGLAKGAPAPTVYVRDYEHCKVKLDCTDAAACKATIDGPSRTTL